MQHTSIFQKYWKLSIIKFYLNRALNICSNSPLLKKNLQKLSFKNQYSKHLIESKINLETYEIDNSTFRQNQKINKKNEKKTDMENWPYFTTVYVGSCSIQFEKRIASIFHKHKIVIKPAYNSRKSFWKLQRQK